MGARGHSLLRAATDTELEVVAEGLELTAKRTVTATKQRDAAGGGAPIEFMLNEVLLGTDKKGRDLKTCTIVLQGDPEWEFAHTMLLRRSGKGANCCMALRSEAALARASLLASLSR